MIAGAVAIFLIILGLMGLQASRDRDDARKKNNKK